MSDFIIQTDGGSRGNPGPSAIGVVLKSADPSGGRAGGSLKREYGEYIGITTNNDAEYQAVIFGLKKLKHLIGKAKAAHAHIEVVTDSELLERQLNGHFKIMDPKIQKHFMELWNLKVDFGDVTYRHVYREDNKEADRMVNVALDKETNKLL